MSNRFSSNPPDEPVIGATYPNAYDDENDPHSEWDDDEYAAEDEYDEYDEYGEEPYDDDYYDEAPARQPIFYVAIGLVVLLFAGILFAAVFFVGNRNDGDTPAAPTQPQVGARIRVDAPLANERFEVGKVNEVLVSANATEPIVTFELYVNDQLSDSVPAGEPDDEQVYHPILQATLNSRGEHSLFVRLITQSGAKQDSDKVSVVAVEAVASPAAGVRGRLLTVTTIRSGPSETAQSVGNAREGLEVTIAGRTQDSEWLFIESTPPGWVPRNAVEPLDALSLVPVRSASPTPTRTPEQTASPTSVANTQTPEPQDLPDLTPSNAQLIDGGAGLRVSVANLATTQYDGPLEVSVTGLTTGTLTRVFAVRVPPGGSVTVDFELDPPISSTLTAQIRVDPGNALAEGSEDNNSISVSLTPPSEPPEIIIATQAASNAGVSVTIRNDGGPLGASAVSVRVRMGNLEASQTQHISLSSGETASFGPIAKPAPAGEATIEVLVDGGVVASTTIEITN